MALIVEDGTGLPDAEAFIGVADATAYHAARGNDSWAALASDTVREQLLRRATDYLGQVYGERWAGDRVSTTQALDWPRSGVVARGAALASDAVPVEVERACAELALRAIDGDLAPDPTAPVIREKVGPLETEYAQGARQTTTYRAIDLLLAPLLSSSGSLVKVTRA